MNAINYVRVWYGANELKFLCDTGASISCFFANQLVDRNNIDTSKKIKIKGIAGFTFSRGSANISFSINNETLSHEFCIVDEFDSSVRVGFFR